MKNKIIIANWKMSLTHKETLEVAKQCIQFEKSIKPDTEVVLCPSFISLSEVANMYMKSNIKIGAQDIFWEEQGAFTGEISPRDIKALGCRYVILGHSERRKYLHETSEMVHNKTRVALKNGLTPIICIGEDWEERQKGQKDYVIIRELNDILGGVPIQNENIIIAYEPIWAVSTGKGIYAEPEEVQYVHEVIRQVLLDLYDLRIINNCFQIIYGGSVTSRTVRSYTSIPNVAGVLVGSASLNPEEFFTLIGNA